MKGPAKKSVGRVRLVFLLTSFLLHLLPGRLLLEEKKTFLGNRKKLCNYHWVDACCLALRLQRLLPCASKRRDSALDILAHDAPDTALLEERKIV